MTNYCFLPWLIKQRLNNVCHHEFACHTFGGHVPSSGLFGQFVGPSFRAAPLVICRVFLSPSLSLYLSPFLFHPLCRRTPCPPLYRVAFEMQFCKHTHTHTHTHTTLLLTALPLPLPFCLRLCVCQTIRTLSGARAMCCLSRAGSRCVARPLRVFSSPSHTIMPAPRSTNCIQLRRAMPDRENAEQPPYASAMVLLRA